MATGRSWNVQPDCWGERWSWGSVGERESPQCLSLSCGKHTPSEAPGRKMHSTVRAEVSEYGVWTPRWVEQDEVGGSFSPQTL